MPEDAPQQSAPLGSIAAGAAAGGGLVAGLLFFKSNLLLFLGVLAVLLILGLGGYFVFIHLKKRRQSQRFGSGIGTPGAAPRGISDPAKRAKLEEMRKTFEEGIQKYRARGKDLYSLPWFVIVGEPGGGKSEAIRRSNIGFPPGLQNELQGVGGTINMNWWFSDQAVILDTAGRLIFEEVPAGESSEWTEFLNLLKLTRPNCPINGLLLVIPCDALIKDTDLVLDQKAKKLSQQLDLIQRTLDIRFPVSVLITKSDLLMGFREFFDDLKDPRLQHQMLGWSNPQPRDAAFKPEEVDQFLNSVAARLSRRRLAKLRDPAPEVDGGRRADEVDALYSLPQSLGSVAPRLRRYLETAFKSGQWSLPPLFLRGIYFSSSLREGAALDAKLANALGVPLESVVDFKAWDRERSFFLKDLLVEKLFKERGLVTRATNTHDMLRARRLWLYGGGTAALAAFLALAWLGMTSFRSSMKAQGEAWAPVAKIGWDPDTKAWSNSLVPIGQGGAFVPVTDSAAFDRAQVELGFLHNQLKTQSTNDLKLDWVSRMFFSRLGERYNMESRKAQRIVFETGVVKPLVTAARQKFRLDPPLTGESAIRQAEAFRTLLELEADLAAGGLTNFGRPDPKAVRRFADPLLQYVAGVNLDTNLVATWSWLYSRNPATLSGDLGTWPPTWLSEHESSKAPLLREYPGLYSALAAVIRSATNRLAAETVRWTEVAEMHRRLKGLGEQERRLMAAVSKGDFTAANTQLTGLLQATRDQEGWFGEHRNSSLVARNSLAGAWEDFRAGAGGGALVSLAQLSAAVSNILTRYNSPMFTEVRDSLQECHDQLTRQLTVAVQEMPEKEMKSLDAELLTQVGGNRAYVVRVGIYGGVQEFSQEDLDGGEKVGRKDQFFRSLEGRMGQLKMAGDGYDGPMVNEFKPTYERLVDHARRGHVAAFYRGYLAEATNKLAGFQGFPLEPKATRRLPLDEVKAANDRISEIRQDLAVFDAQRDAPPSDPVWRDFRDRIKRYDAMLNALIGDNKVPTRVAVSILGQRAGEEEDGWRNQFEFVKATGGGPTQRIGRSGDNDKDKVLVTLAIDQPIVLSFNERDREARLNLRTGSWGPVELIYQGRGDPDPTQDRAWIVEWPIEEAGVKGKLRLRLSFSRPLPDRPSH